MTGPQDNQDTRPISVAELLARNGTIGAPPVGGRRRLRRGNTDAVTVAELTGEIPIVHDGQLSTPAANGAVEVDDAPADPAADEGADRPESADELIDDAADEAEALEEDHSADYNGGIDGGIDGAPAEDARLRLDDGKFVSAEEMAPDPIDIDDELPGPAGDAAQPGADPEADEVPSYLNASPEPLFGGRSPQHDLVYDGDTEAVSTVRSAPTTTADDVEDAEPPSPAQKILGGTLVVVQSILAVAFGAGLFIAFDQLWKWNNIVALVLSVLVILGLVAAVWVVRKTEDIASTLIAVAVGALVTMGPLVLHTN
ncbi:MAG: hypothetical protein QOH57_4333 [Mycobacterium sp.]|jgi:hypothetical protein|nr:hypothetical protein [Mycobacterium sp.]